MQVVQTLDICMAVILAGLGTLYVIQERILPNQFPADGLESTDESVR
jgi:hypothetical protein